MGGGGLTGRTEPGRPAAGAAVSKRHVEHDRWHARGFAYMHGANGTATTEVWAGLFLVNMPDANP